MLICIRENLTVGEQVERQYRCCMKDALKSHDNIACFGQRMAQTANLMSDSETPAPAFSDLDETWATELRDAEARARAAGRADIAEYLALRKSNDRLRKIACDWLLETFRNVAGEMNRAGASLQISNDDNYQFTVANAALVGKLLKLENGVRQLLVEVGWPRVPAHGFISGGGIALGRLRHLGIKSASDQIRLVISPEGSPRWIVENKPEPVDEIREANIRHHISILLDSSRVDQNHF